MFKFESSQSPRALLSRCLFFLSGFTLPRAGMVLMRRKSGLGNRLADSTPHRVQGWSMCVCKWSDKLKKWHSGAMGLVLDNSNSTVERVLQGEFRTPLKFWGFLIQEELISALLCS